MGARLWIRWRARAATWRRWGKRTAAGWVALWLGLVGFLPLTAARADAASGMPVSMVVLTSPSVAQVGQSVTFTTLLAPEGLLCAPAQPNTIIQVFSGRPLAEVFTAPANLSLSDVEFEMAQEASGPLTVELAPWSAGGPGNPIATTTISPQGIAYGDTANTLVAANFSPGVSLTGGQAYAVVLSVASQSNDVYNLATVSGCASPATYINVPSGWVGAASVFFDALTTPGPDSGTVSLLQGGNLLSSAPVSFGTNYWAATLTAPVPTAAGTANYTLTYSGNSQVSSAQVTVSVPVQPGPAVSGTLTGPSAGQAGAILGPYTWTVQDVYGNSALGPLTATLASSPSGLNFYASSSGGQPISQLTIPGGQSTAQFWVSSDQAGNYTLSLQSTLPELSQAIAIQPGPPSILKVVGPSIWTVGKQIGPFTLQTFDALNNPTTVPSGATSGLSVELGSSPPGVAFYENAGATVPASSVTIPPGSGQVQVWAKVYQGGAYTLAFSPGQGLASVTYPVYASEAPGLSFSPTGLVDEASLALGQRIPLYVTAGSDDSGLDAITVQAVLAGTQTVVGAVYTASTGSTPVTAVYAAPGTTITAYYDPGPTLPPGPITLTASDLYGSSPPLTLELPTAGPLLTRTLEPGWNTWSVPFAVYNPQAPLTAWLSNPSALLLALTYDPETGQWSQVTGSAPPPMQGVYLDVAPNAGPVTATVLPALQPMPPPTWSISPGWNLVGPSAASGSTSAATFLTGVPADAVPLMVDPTTDTPMPSPGGDTTDTLQNGFAYWLYATTPEELLGQLATPGTTGGAP